VRRATIVAVLALLVMGTVGAGCTQALAGDAGAAPALVRQVAANESEIGVTDPSASDTLDVTVTVTNTLPIAMATQGPPPGYVYQPGESYLDPRFAQQPGRWRVAVGPAGLEASELPYRWGLGNDLPAGASTIVTGRVKLAPGREATTFVAVLLQEPPKLAHVGSRWGLIAAAPNNRAIVVVDVATLYGGPSSTSAVVDQAMYGTEVRLLERSGSWLKVQLPDRRQGWLADDWVVAAAT